MFSSLGVFATNKEKGTKVFEALAQGIEGHYEIIMSRDQRAAELNGEQGLVIAHPQLLSVQNIE